MYEANYGQNFGALFYLFIFAFYFYYGFAQYKIAQKIGHESPWWSFIPFLNAFQLVQLARKEWYWFLFFFIPFVNIIPLAIVWWHTAKNCGHSPVWGLLTIVPFINFISIGIMAFAQGSYHRESPFPEYQHTAPRQTEKVG
ncbi:MAG: DUF5684 domain-containing protein [Candidatus Zixiibacteriota bacterium]